MKKLFVMGGGGFAMEPENLLLDQYLLKLSDKSVPKVSFIGTASGDSEHYHNKFYSAYNQFSCRPSHLSLFRPHTKDIEGYIKEQDIIHVGGGNTRNLLILWKEWGIDRYLYEAYADGVILSGMSAGMVCWFEEFITDSFGGGLQKFSGLGWLKGSACPHFDGEVDRRPKFTELIRSRQISGGLALDDGVGTLFNDEKIIECVSSRKSAGAYLFSTGEAREEKVSVKYLGNS